jgi:hypothetical protein
MSETRGLSEQQAESEGAGRTSEGAGGARTRRTVPAHHPGARCIGHYRALGRGENGPAVAQAWAFLHWAPVLQVSLRPGTCPAGPFAPL